MLQPSTSMDGEWKSADEFFKFGQDDQDDVDDIPMYRSVASMIPEWHSEAECRTKDKSVFFGSSSPEERPAYTLSSIREARTLCAICPVFNECLAHAIRTREVYGLWAGTTMNQRKGLFRKIECGELTEQQVIDALKRRPL